MGWEQSMGTHSTQEQHQQLLQQLMKTDHCHPLERPFQLLAHLSASLDSHEPNQTISSHLNTSSNAETPLC